MIRVRAAVTERSGRIRVQEFPLPEPGAVLMKLCCTGIGGTDKHTSRQWNWRRRMRR